MPWGYTFLEVQNGSRISHTAVYIPMYISELTSFDHIYTVLALFGTVLALFSTVWHCSALLGIELTSVLTSE